MISFIVFFFFCLLVYLSEEAYLSVEPEGESLDDAVVLLLEKCQVLESLDIQTTLLVETVETIYQKAYEGKISELVCGVIGKIQVSLYPVEGET